MFFDMQDEQVVFGDEEVYFVFVMVVFVEEFGV